MIRGLGLPTRPAEEVQQEGNLEAASHNNLAAILPLLTSLPQPGENQGRGEPKPSRFLVAKGLPTLPMKLVDKAWNKEYVEMEEFLPTPRALRLVDQGGVARSLQESLVGALSQFQAIQQQQKSQRPGLDILTWTKCFSLYIAVMSRKHPEMIPSMVAHMHTVLKLYQKVPRSTSWYEYDVRFRMEMAASEDWTWTSGDPWQYITCIPGPSGAQDPFDMAEEALHVQAQKEPVPDSNSEPMRHLSTSTQPPGSGKGRKLPYDPERGNTKRTKRAGAYRLFHRTPGGCTYGKECIFMHSCSNCDATNEHSLIACPFPPQFPPGPSTR